MPDEPTPEEAQAGAPAPASAIRRLQFLTWLDEAGGYVDARGQPGRAPAGYALAASRPASTDERAGPLAALVHDAALLHQRGLLDEVVAAARLAIEKDRGLQALRRSEARSRRSSTRSRT